MTIHEVELEFTVRLQSRSKTEMIVLHHSASAVATVETIHALHLLNGYGGIGYHYLVRKDGSIWRGRPENVVGAHSKGNNLYSIGICFEGNFENEEMGEAQVVAGVELIKDILSRYGELEIVGHRDLQATACPGKGFPISAFTAVQEEEGKEEAEDDGPAAWAKDACEKCVELGLFLGDGKGNYRWRDYVSRQELAVVLMRMRGLENG